MSGCFFWPPIVELPVNVEPTIEMSNPAADMPIELDPAGPGAEVLVVVHDEDPESLYVLWETDKEGFQSQWAPSPGIGKGDIGYQLHLPPETKGEQTLTFRVEDDFGESVSLEWNIVLLEVL